MAAVSKELVGQALDAFAAFFGPSPGLAHGCPPEFILSRWHAVFLAEDEDAFKRGVVQVLRTAQAFPVPADVLRAMSAPTASTPGQPDA